MNHSVALCLLTRMALSFQKCTCEGRHKSWNQCSQPETVANDALLSSTMGRLQPKIFFWNGFLSNYHKSPPHIWLQPQLTIISSSIISTCKPQLWKCLTVPPKQWTHSTHPLEEECFITGQPFTTACLARSSAIQLPSLTHFNKTISRMHSHLPFNKIHNTITSSYNTSIFLFG
jgi:hypothetical protein